MRQGVAVGLIGGAIVLAGLVPASALAQAPAQDIIFTAAGVERHAVIQQPDSAKPVPVVLVFPREGMSAGDAVTRFGPAVLQAKAAIIALDALPCFRLGGATCWAPMEASGRQPIDITAVTGLLNDLDRRTDLDTTRIIALGESSGGAFSVTLTRSLPSRIDGALAISAFDPTRVVTTNAEGQVAFPLALTGTSTIARQKSMNAITIVRASNDASIPPQLSKDLYTRLATRGWKQKATLVTIGGVGAGDPQLASPVRITKRINALLRSALHLDTPIGVQKRLRELGYLPARSLSSEYALQQALMAFQGWEGLTRDGVAGASTQVALATASRPTPAGRGGEKRVEVDIGKQVMLLVSAGKVVRTVHVSTGSAGNTPRGRYSVFRKELMSWSIPFKSWMPFAAYFTGGFAFHEYPDVPGYPASKGCVRIGSPFAPGVYEFATYGTPVYVY